jgi:hypothetical protein
MSVALNLSLPHPPIPLAALSRARLEADARSALTLHTYASTRSHGRPCCQKQIGSMSIERRYKETPVRAGDEVLRNAAILLPPTSYIPQGFQVPAFNCISLDQAEICRYRSLILLANYTNSEVLVLIFYL